MVWALPCGVTSAILHVILHQDSNLSEQVGAGDVGASVLAGFTFILGFLVVFRSQQAYSRWWEGGTLLQQLRGEWFNAFSSLVAFCNNDRGKEDAVLEFQHQLARLHSLLYYSAIRSVSTMKDQDYELIDVSDFDGENMRYMLYDSNDGCEVCLQWIQRLIGDANEQQILKVAPPILSRVYNQLGNGIVMLNNARKIKEFPIPFPLAQMITFMMLIHWVITALVCAASVERFYWAGILSFIVTFSFWGITYIAVELEQPFGDDANDLPLHDMQKDMNASLQSLLDVRAHRAPKYTFKKGHQEMARSTEKLGAIFKPTHVETPKVGSQLPDVLVTASNVETPFVVALLPDGRVTGCNGGACAHAPQDPPQVEQQNTLVQPKLVSNDVVHRAAPLLPDGLVTGCNGGACAHAPQDPPQNEQENTLVQPKLVSNDALHGAAPPLQNEFHGGDTEFPKQDTFPEALPPLGQAQAGTHGWETTLHVSYRDHASISMQPSIEKFASPGPAVNLATALRPFDKTVSDVAYRPDAIAVQRVAQYGLESGSGSDYAIPTSTVMRLPSYAQTQENAGVTPDADGTDQSAAKCNAQEIQILTSSNACLEAADLRCNAPGKAMLTGNDNLCFPAPVKAAAVQQRQLGSMT